MSESNRSRLSWLVVPGVITFAIVLIRLWGEISGWSTDWFGTAAGGGAEEMSKENPQPAPSLVGIFWLIPLFGIYFGARLRRNGISPEHSGKAVLFSVIGLAIFIATVSTVMQIFAKEQEGDPTKTVEWFWYVGYIFGAAGWIGVAVTFFGWKALARLELGYALLARLPIIILTVILVSMNKGTHFEKLGPPAPEMSDAIRTYLLCLAQVCFWMPLTILVGMLFGTLTALVVPARSRS